MLHDWPFLRAVFFFFLPLTFLVHCAGPQVAKEEEKAKLRSRIDEYWQYRIKGDVERAYQCELPAFRETVSILQYVNRFKLVRYVDAEVQEIDIDVRDATSKTKVTYIVFFKAFRDRKLSKLEQEKWVKIENTWYHVPEDFDMKKDESKS